MKWDSEKGKMILSNQELEDITRDEVKFLKEFCDPTKHPYTFDETKKQMIPNPNYKESKN